MGYSYSSPRETYKYCHHRWSGSLDLSIQTHNRTGPLTCHFRCSTQSCCCVCCTNRGSSLGRPQLPVLLTNPARRQDDESPFSAAEWSAVQLGREAPARLFLQLVIMNNDGHVHCTASVDCITWFWGEGPKGPAICGGDICIHLSPPHPHP